MLETKTSSLYYAMAEKEGKFDGTPAKEIVAFLREQIRAGSSVLDIGCGVAGILTQLPDAFHYQGLDISEFAVQDAEKAWKERPNTAFAQSDLHSVPFKNESFDIVLSINSLEHMLNPASLMLEIKRVLKPNGYFVVTAPNFELPFQSTPGRRLAPYCLRYKSMWWRLGFFLKRLYSLALRMVGAEVFELVPENITDSKGIYEYADDDLRYLVCSSTIVAFLARNGMALMHFYSKPVGSAKSLLRKIPGLTYIGTPLGAVFKRVN